MTTCHNCGFNQPDGPKCVKCSSLFSYYSGEHDERASTSDARIGAPSSRIAIADEISPARKFLKRLRKGYAIFQWASLAVLLIVVLLILHKAPPPQVPSDPQAAARAESKFAAAQAAAQQHQPYQLKLDRTELNSYLNSNLQLPNHDAPQTTATPSSPAAPDSNPISAIAAPDAATPDPSLSEVQSAVKDVKVDMEGDLVKAYVVFNFHGKDMSLELDGHLSSSNGYLQFDPVAGQLGSLPLPQSTLNAAVEKMLSSPENREKLRLPPGISDLKVVNGQVVVNYK
ncbi:MAG: hypothetical protein ACRD37_04905 [Candidatus Acidiferrales bacterium]